MSADTRIVLSVIAGVWSMVALLWIVGKTSQLYRSHRREVLAFEKAFENFRLPEPLPPLVTPILRIRVGSPLVDLVSPECVDDLDELERSLTDGGVEILDGDG